MNYRNSEMKIDQLVNYLNEEKINLSPAFQRGHVWTMKARKSLIKNIILGKPIPAIFLYKEAVGSKYSYNILDGKQRLESVILFVADKRDDVRIQNWARYFFTAALQKTAGFKVDLTEGKKAFADLGDDLIREFREYSIPTIEISLGDESSLDEVITLFVDINQQGEPVKRFDIVKALYKGDPLLKSVFNLLAREEKRGQDVFYKAVNNEFTAVLKRLQVVDAISSPNARVDKMWEKLLEIALFVRSHKHRKPVEILKEFIAPHRGASPKLTVAEVGQLRRVFRFLRELLPDLAGSRLFTDQTHSYTLVTSVIRADLIGLYGEADLARRLRSLAKPLDKSGTSPGRAIQSRLRQYRDLSAKQTTDVSRRMDRDRLFVEIIEMV